MTGSACFLKSIFCLDDMVRQPVCGGLLVFAQGTNRVKNAEISERRGFQRFFVSGKVTPSFSQNRAGMRGFLFEVDGIGNFLKLF